MNSVLEMALEALIDLVKLASKKICPHEETHRGCAIWEICDVCWDKWADDEGGKPAYAEPAALVAGNHAIAALKEAIKNQGEPVAYFDPLVADDDKGLSWTSGTFHTGKLYKGGEL